MTKASLRRAPKGFSPSQWRTFQENGLLIVENALGQDEIETYLEGTQRVHKVEGSSQPGGFFGTQNFIEKDRVFASLIDRPSHLGLVYDLYSEMLKLQLSELFIRSPRAGGLERWHYDGPRVLPYATAAQRA